MLRIYRVLFALVLSFCQSVSLVHSQDENPPGFLSIDCGLPEGSDYKDSTTGIYYQSDAKMIDSGESKSLLPATMDQHLSTLRSFPRGTKNCYTIQPSPGKGNRYLIRATFKYGNYDTLNQSPTFDLNLGPDTWSKITFEDGVPVVRKEIIHVLSSDYIHVCLINTGTGTPFISALELRPLNSSSSIVEDIHGKSNTSTPIVLGAVIGAVLLLAAILFGIWIFRRRVMQETKKLDKQPQGNISAIERKDRRFTYSQVLDITKNLQENLGAGGFGKVYRGSVGDVQVAVKMLSPSSDQGYREFLTEVSLLMKIHHKNLTSLVGYCYEGTHMGIIYEYMANGNLDEYLSGNRNGMSSWEIRLKIALDAAQGLEYLHHGCKPAIIHRDVKTSNILLNEKLQAKLADFGLSKAYPAEGGTHISTNVAGTPGYIDPDYNPSNRRLTEKSDVFGFGVVLLVMITGRPPVSRSDDRIHISQWVELNVRNGDLTEVVDQRFGGKYDVNSVWKTVELALWCTSRNSSRRPTMNMAVINLKECLAIEIGSQEADPDDSYEMFSTDPERSLVPRPR